MLKTRRTIFHPTTNFPATGRKSPDMEIYLVDGTYELFRHYYALPSARDQSGREVAAVRGVLNSVQGMIKGGATHIAVATDKVIESFRNGLWPGYKTGEGIDPDLFSQFPLLEETLSAAGITVWPMVEFEADDALAAGAAAAARDSRVDRVIICTPDKDLAQCVIGTRVVQLNRRTRVTYDEAGVIQKFGVPPVSIPDYLALVGDTVRRLSRPARLGREVDRRGPGQIRPSGIDPGGFRRLARQRFQRRRASRNTFPRARTRAAVPNPRNPAHRYSPVRGC